MDLNTLILLCIFAFLAGFVDAIVGGGGLIQLPAGIMLLPQFPVATVMGSLKIPAFTGTAFAAKQYLKKVTVNWKQVGNLRISVRIISLFMIRTMVTPGSPTTVKAIIFYTPKTYMPPMAVWSNSSTNLPCSLACVMRTLHTQPASWAM